MIERATSADRINAILNHPSVRSYVVTNDDESLDVTSAVANQRNHFLLGEYGTVLCFWVGPGVYEFHVAVLPEGRGDWTIKFAMEVEEYMFIKTDAVELMTRIPDGHRASLALAKSLDYRIRWKRPECVWKGKKQAYSVFSKTMQRWVEDVDLFDVLSSMVEAGNVEKAMAWERRWSVLSREGPARHHA